MVTLDSRGSRTTKSHNSSGTRNTKSHNSSGTRNIKSHNSSGPRGPRGPSSTTRVFRYIIRSAAVAAGVAVGLAWYSHSHSHPRSPSQEEYQRERLRRKKQREEYILSHHQHHSHHHQSHQDVENYKGERQDLQLLGVSSAMPSKKEIEKAYRKKALEMHPDKHPASEHSHYTEKFAELSEAYKRLTEPKGGNPFRGIFEQFFKQE